MKITSISAQKRDSNRVNISIDGKYRFSLDIYQVIELGIKNGLEYSDEDISKFEKASQFGKIYNRSLAYCIERPRSVKELKDYLSRKTRPTRLPDGTLRPGLPSDMIEPVINRLIEKGYLDDRKFTVFWVNNRFVKKGVSKRRLTSDLLKKGVDIDTIKEVINQSDRVDSDELRKVIEKKRTKYDDKGLMSYLARQGFNYDDIKQALNED